MSAEDLELVKGIVVRWELAITEDHMNNTPDGSPGALITVDRLRRLLTYIRWLEDQVPDYNQKIKELERNVDRQTAGG